jgi:hypothetical protein
MFPPECAPSRRNFLKTTAALATSVAGLTFLSTPAFSEDADVNVIGPKKSRRYPLLVLSTSNLRL